MKKLNRYELEFEPTLAYFQFILNNANALSSCVLNLVDFKAGHFFTLLPENINEEKLYEFLYGGKGEPIEELVIAQILNSLYNNKNLSCIFDDVRNIFDSEYNDSLYLTCGITYEKEIYYLINSKNTSKQFLERCFYISNAIWHSLCVLSEINLNNLADKKISLNQIADICLNADLIIVSAYDAEGYIFWESNKREPVLTPYEFIKANNEK